MRIEFHHIETSEHCSLATYSHWIQKIELNELISWRWKNYIQTNSWMFETKLFVMMLCIL